MCRQRSPWHPGRHGFDAAHPGRHGADTTGRCGQGSTIGQRGRPRSSRPLWSLSYRQVLIGAMLPIVVAHRGRHYRMMW